MCKCLVSERDLSLLRELQKNTAEIKTVVRRICFAQNAASLGDIMRISGQLKLRQPTITRFDSSSLVRRSCTPRASLRLIRAWLRCVLLAFCIMDRFSGTVWSATNRDWATSLVEPLLSNVCSCCIEWVESDWSVWQAFFYLFVSVGAWLSIAFLALRVPAAADQ